ncbi:MAG: PSP1 C-terminal domain-containing protein [Pirellulaceae bacterium]
MVHLVQIGLLGSVGRFHAVDRRTRGRGTQVICRTERGLEVGHVLTTLEIDTDQVDGELLRRVTPDDRLLINRIERFREKAFDDCLRLLKQHDIPATLVEVEHLFDGQNLFFYFLGEVTPQLDAITGELAETYESRVKFRRFAETLARGCGPECGSGAAGCGSEGCASCAVRESCKS